MPFLEISYQDFDTVCYSVQHNLEQLIKHAVAIGIQININTGNLENMQQTVDKIEQETEGVGDDVYDLGKRLNTLQLDLNELERQYTQLLRDFNTFSYAVTADLGTLKNRVDELEQRVG